MSPLAMFVWTLGDVVGLGLWGFFILGALVWLACAWVKGLWSDFCGWRRKRHMWRERPFK